MEKELLYPLTNKCRFDQKLDGLWDFEFDRESQGLADNWTAKLPDPIKMPVPASFNDFFTDKDSREYTGDFWYAKRVFVPGSLRGKQIGLDHMVWELTALSSCLADSHTISLPTNSLVLELTS